MEDQSADARFRFHHHAFRELNTDLFRVDQLPDALLVVEVGAGRVTEAVALAAIAGSEALLHGHRGRVGKAPVFANAAMQPFRAAFGGFDSERLQPMGEEVFAALLHLLGALAHAGAGGNDEDSEMIPAAILLRQDVIAEAESVGAGLAAEVESMERRCGAGLEEMD